MEEGYLKAIICCALNAAEDKILFLFFLILSNVLWMISSWMAFND